MTIRLTRALFLSGIAPAFAIILCGCSVLSPQKDQTRYFVLIPAAESGQSTSTVIPNASRTVTVGLGPITLPRYLERPEVITRLTNSEFSVSETDRWGESLDSNVSRVLAQDLSSTSSRLEVIPFPWGKRAQIDYRVGVEFLRLERTADGKAEVQAIWTIRQGIDNELVRRSTTVFSAATGHDPSSASAALSEGVAAVAHEIAQVLDRVAQAKNIASAQRPPSS